MVPVKRQVVAKKIAFCFISVLLIAFSSCENDNGKDNTETSHHSLFSSGFFNADDFKDQLVKKLPAVDTTDSLFLRQKMMPVSQAVRYVYMNADYQPLWFTEHGVSDAAGQLLNELGEMKWDGLKPEKYHVAELKKQLDEINAAKEITADKAIAFDTACTRSYLQASRDLLLGSINPKRADSLWFHANDSVWDAPSMLIAQLGRDKKYPSVKVFRSEISTYALMQQALHHYTDLAADNALSEIKNNLGEKPADSVVEAIISKEIPDLFTTENDSVSKHIQLLRGYQYYYGLRPSGKLDSATLVALSRSSDSTALMLAVNMERLRWLPRKLEKQYVLVNVPMMEFFLRRDGVDAFHMRVVVGRPSRQTPTLGANMVNIVFNPPWGVPPTILKKEVLPGITKSGAAYLRRKGLHAFDHNGKAVDAGNINENNYRRFSYRQPPGDRNSLGVVKFNLPNPWDIYLHDTPHKEDFPMRYRAKSSGCIRLQQPRQLAEYILTQIEGREKFDQAAIDTLVQTHKTRYEILKNKIPVHILYLTAFEDSTGKQLRFLDDVYKRDGKLLSLVK
ncbi:L,D-transpeptidase family protein [Chitinophagaceae bacterium MMS25-I14]